MTDRKTIRRNARKTIGQIFENGVRAVEHTASGQYIGVDISVSSLEKYFYEHLIGKSYVKMFEYSDKYLIKVASDEWYYVFKE